MVMLIGDIHGEYNRYLNLIKNTKTSIQLGDFGFKFDCLDNVDSGCHKICGGNHDNYDILVNKPHYLGDFGSITIDGIELFFIRGAFSVDRQWRIPGVSWWLEEELSIKRCFEAIEAFKQTKPKIVISHDCPQCCLPYVITNKWKLEPSKTVRMMQECFNIHKPELWIHAHHHRSVKYTIDSTTFLCLDEFESYSLTS